MARLGHCSTALFLVWLPACGDDLLEPLDAECDDDAIGWAIDIESIVPVPRPEFAVECETGWGHGVATRAASETVALSHGYEWIMTHPQGGFLLMPYGPVQGWSDRLGVPVASESLLWVDEELRQVHWRRDDLAYRWPTIITTASGIELWVIGWDDEGQSLARIDAVTGDLLERVPWPNEHSYSWDAAWPADGGIWYDVRLEFGAGWQRQGLVRMASFGEAQVVREREVTRGEGVGPGVGGVHPTPGGGALWSYNSEIESVAEDGSLRWTLTEPHCGMVVDDRGGFLLGCTRDEDSKAQRAGVGIQRRSLADAGLLWSRVHHRFAFAEPPRSEQWLISFTHSLQARPSGGYVIAGWHAYPSSKCPGQPLLMAIDEQGEVEWAHRSETCGAMLVIGPPTDHGLFVRAGSFDNGDGSNGNTKAGWLHRFDL